MSKGHRRIPVLPDRPSFYNITCKLRRSYHVGRHNFSRAFQGEVIILTITKEDSFSEAFRARLMTTISSHSNDEWIEAPFVLTDDRTLTCRVFAERPGLKSFRAEFSIDGGISWFRDTVSDAWILIDPPQVNGLRLYTMIPTISGTIADWKADLKRISSMGFNAIHLLPLTTLDTSESPYSAKDLFNIDHSYLDRETGQDALTQLEEFIQEAKKLDIKLCFDLVLNHVGVHSIMARKVPDWIVPDADQPDGLMRARYWCSEGWCSWNDLVLINYEHPSKTVRSEIWAYMIDYALFWAKYANDTGGFVRFDNLHSSNPDFVKALTAAIRSEYPEIGILAEYFADETTLLHTGPQWGLNLHLATPWDYKFVPQLREYLKYIHRVSEHIRYYMPVTSHDSGTPAQEFGTEDSTIPRYVAAALLGTGATGIVQGVEFGEQKKIEFIGRKQKKCFPEEIKYADLITKINSILINHQAFRHGGNCQFVDNGHAAVISAFRRDKGVRSSGYLVICNFDTGHSQQITIDLSSILEIHGTVSCSELIKGKTLVFPNLCLELSLPQNSAYVLKFG